jgi:hypothetical protein
MFNGYFEIVLADQDLAADRAATEKKQARSQWMLAGAAGFAGLWGLRLWRNRRKVQAAPVETARS